MSALTKVEDAPLPANYVAAQKALEVCSRIDECKSIKDKALAMMVYARQAKDPTLYVEAKNIQGRALRRMGELLKEIEMLKGRPEKKPGGAAGLSQTRKMIAKEYGVSPDQQLDAIRLANIPKKEFEKQLAAEKPPTLTELAKLGTKPRAAPSTSHLEGRDPKEFNQAMHALGKLRQMAEMCNEVTPALIVRGTLDRFYDDMRAWVKTVEAWTAKVKTELAAMGTKPKAPKRRRIVQPSAASAGKESA